MYSLLNARRELGYAFLVVITVLTVASAVSTAPVSASSGISCCVNYAQNVCFEDESCRSGGGGCNSGAGDECAYEACCGI